MGHKRGRVTMGGELRSTCRRCGVNLVRETDGWKVVDLVPHRKGLRFRARQFWGSLSCRLGRHAPALEAKRWVSRDEGIGSYETGCRRCAVRLRRSRQVWTVIREDAG